jgi:hypothetical protein
MLFILKKLIIEKFIIENLIIVHKSNRLRI